MYTKHRYAAHMLNDRPRLILSDLFDEIGLARLPISDLAQKLKMNGDRFKVSRAVAPDLTRLGLRLILGLGQQLQDAHENVVRQRGVES